jgi:hypothetical protein
LTLDCNGKDALGFAVGSVVKGLIPGYMPVAFFYTCIHRFADLWLMLSVTSEENQAEGSDNNIFCGINVL